MSNRIADLFHSLIRLYCESPKESPSDWACRNLRFNEPNNCGPFSLLGREYNREPINTIAEPTITDLVLVYGSQSGKTASIMALIAWVVRFMASRVLWVMPNSDGTGGAKNFSVTRWQPMLLASEVIRRMLPSDKRREFKNAQQRINGSIIDFVGSNSPANLASNPCRVQVMDEVDKFNDGTTKEADAVELIEQRGKRFGNPKRIKTSTPTVPDGLIWREFMKGDQRRYFVPCVHCVGHIVFAWSESFTVMKKTGCEGYVHWDREAKRADGSWDYERVKASAHVKCPHCQGRINDSDKTKMVRSGEWRPTNPGASKAFRSYHLPSLYASSPSTSFGALAVKFLEKKKSLDGLQGFINGDLAEPYQSQDRQAQRVEIITSKIDVTAEWKSQMTIDCQATRNHGAWFWFVKRAWSERESVAISAGGCDTWDELRAAQGKAVAWHNAGDAMPDTKDAARHVATPDACVMVDSGFGARSDADVYANCARFGEFMKRKHPMLPLHIGWMPAKGFPSKKTWKDQETGAQVPFYSRSIDPFLGTTDAGKVQSTLFEFSGEYFKDLLETLRADKEGKCGHKWSVAADVATEEYWRHMDGKIKKGRLNKFNGRTVYEWSLRGRNWPDHLDDCEIQQIALAAFLGIFKLPDL
jgi:hypothetical protein